MAKQAIAMKTQNFNTFAPIIFVGIYGYWCWEKITSC